MMTNNNNNNEEEYEEESVSNTKDNNSNNNSGVNFLIPSEKTATTVAATATAPSMKMKTKTKRRKPAVNIRARGPQFSLADWQRLVHSSNDLAQRNGIPFRKDIPWEEISKHNKEHDCWIVLRGIVYNIGPYLPYHPGGIEIFHNAKNILGNPDGTRADKSFDKYHKYISIEGLIGSLAIGTAAASDAATAATTTDADATT
jgi:cytochrome b involved in lipid metabolism